MWCLVCGVTIFPRGLIAGRNGILTESLLRESNFTVSVMSLLMKMGGSFFSKNIIWAQSLYNLEEGKVHPKHYAFCAFCILSCFLFLDHAND